jgi:hypothetical protein
MVKMSDLRKRSDMIKWSKEEIVSIKKIGQSQRVFLINNLFIYKNDEDVNENAVKMNSLLRSKGLKSPENLLLTVPYTIELTEEYDDNGELIDSSIEIIKTPSTVQIIEYIPNWHDFSIEEAKKKVNDLPKQISQILAFDLLIGNNDRFLFISRYLDNIFFKDDPEYTEMDPFDEPIINEGNLGIVDNDLWSLDIQSNENMLEFLKNLTVKQLNDIQELMIKFMKFNPMEAKNFKEEFSFYRKTF